MEKVVIRYSVDDVEKFAVRGQSIASKPTLSLYTAVTANITGATERTQSKHRAGIANECERPMRGVCEV